MAELEGLQFQISASSDDASKHLNSLADSLGRLKTAVSGIGVSKLKNIAGAIGEVNDASSKGNGDNLTKIAEAVNKLAGVRISSTIATQIRKISESLRSLTEEDISRISSLGAALNNLAPALTKLTANTNGNLKISIKGSAAQVTPKTPELDNKSQNVKGSTKEVEDGAERAKAALRSLRDTLASIGKSTYNAFSGAIRGLRELATGSDFASRGLRGLMKYTVGLPITLGSGFARRIGEATSSLGHLFSAIKRIALYRLIRSVIREITQGLKEGIQHIYAYSNALGGEFAAAMDSLATSSLYLKNSLGAMAAPIIQSLIPAINWAIDRIVALMNVINMFVAALGGKAVATVAKRVQTAFNAAGSAAGGAGGAAKKALKDLKTYTIGIDELNIIDPKDNSGSGSGGGGGGGGGGAIDPASMFEEVDIDSGISNFAKRLREAFKKQDWMGLGKLLGEGFNDIVDKKIKWGELGDKIGSKLGAAITTARWFMETANFENLGGRVAEFISGGLRSINFKDLGSLLFDRIGAAIDFAIGFITTYPTGELALQISDFIQGAFNRAADWIGDHDWYEIGEKFREKITEFFKGLDWEGMWNSLGEFVGKAWNGWSMFASGLFGFTEQDQNKLYDNLNKVYDWFSDPLGLRKHNDKETGHKYYKQKLVRWSDGDVTYRYHDENGNEVDRDTYERSRPINRFKSWLGIPYESPDGAGSTLTNGFAGNGGKMGQTFSLKVENQMKEWRADLKSWWDEKISTPVGSFTVNVKNTATKWWGDVTTWWNGVVGDVQDFTTNVKNEAQLWWNNVKQWWREKITQPVESFRTNVKNEAQTWWNNVKTWWNKTAGELNLKLSLTNNIRDLWEKVKTWWGNTAGTLSTKLQIKMPRIDVKWVDKNLLGTDYKIKVPEIRAVWNAQGAILDGAQIFGMLGNKFLGGGEAGREALLPLDQNTGWMDTIAEKVKAAVGGSSMEMSGAVDSILTRLDTIEARLMGIDDNTRIQAEKPENTYVSIGGKAVRDAVIRQGKADGFSFA